MLTHPIDRSRRAALARSAAIVALLLAATATGACAQRALRAAEDAAARPLPDSIEALVRARVDVPGGVPRVAGEALHTADEVRRFYRASGYRLAWSSRGIVSPAARQLLVAVEAADGEGLLPEDYHASDLARLVAQRPLADDTAALLDLDLLLSDAFLTYARHLLVGRVDPHTIHRSWNLPSRVGDPAAALTYALARGDVGGALGRLRSASPEYARLRQALARYRALAARGPWPSVPAGRLRPGEHGSAVLALRARLAAEAGTEADTSDVYDDALAAAVREFQRTHGLEPDGAAGPETRAELAVPAADRVAQLVASLERTRWISEADLGSPHVAVYIPEFQLVVRENGRPVLGMRVIAGKPTWPTPAFSSAIASLVVNPYWNIPPRILQADIIPRLRRDPSYLARHDIHAVRDVGGVRYRQNPGPGNPLGRLKFAIPNPYDVYLHDTSTPSLFGQANRALSHGCVRIEQPGELAEYVLRATGSTWTPDSISAAVVRGGERTYRLPSRIPVHVIYRTAWVDEDGTVQFRRDVYGHDHALARAFGQHPTRGPAVKRPAAASSAIRPSRDSVDGLLTCTAGSSIFPAP